MSANVSSTVPTLPLEATTSTSLPAAQVEVIKDASSTDKALKAVVALDEEEDPLAQTKRLIRKFSSKYGIDVDTAYGIAYCESGLKQFDKDGKIIRGKVNPDDVGIFQINEKYHLERSRELGMDIYTQSGNIEYAMWMMKKEGVKHWNYSKSCWYGQKIAFNN